MGKGPSLALSKRGKKEREREKKSRKRCVPLHVGPNLPGAPQPLDPWSFWKFPGLTSGPHVRRGPPPSPCLPPKNLSPLLLVPSSRHSQLLPPPPGIPADSSPPLLPPPPPPTRLARAALLTPRRSSSPDSPRGQYFHFFLPFCFLLSLSGSPRSDFFCVSPGRSRSRRREISSGSTSASVDAAAGAGCFCRGHSGRYRSPRGTRDSSSGPVSWRPWRRSR
jgi:hypothetical protein